MNIKYKVIATLLTFLILFGVTGCGISKQAENEKTEISMYLWDKSMSKELTPWLEKQFPDIKFTFVVGYNTMDFYTDLNNRGNLPDIITCRRFSLNDAAHLSEFLMDLSQTEVVGSFYDSYIENNREIGGAIRWLPMCAEVDGYVANTGLFDEYNIPLPTNYAEFVETCRRFEENGISSYMNDYKEDYSCMEALQGCAISDLMTMDGTVWRMEYESSAEDSLNGLDTKVWPTVFEKYEQYLKDTFVEPEDAGMSFSTVKTALLEGQAAIMRGTASDCVVIKQEYGISTTMLPYFGETSEDNWLLTYPTCQVAVNKSVGQNEKKTEAVMRVLKAMFSEEGQRIVATSNAVLSYNKNVNIELSDAFAQVEDCVHRNHLYIRLASTEMFSVSKYVVQKMIRGEYGAQGAYEKFNAMLTEPKNTDGTEVVTTQKTAYDYVFGEQGSTAASAVVNTVCKQWGSDIAIGYSNLITAPVFEGDYTAQQLNWLIANRVSIRQGHLTGAEILQLMEWLVNVKEDGSNPVRHKNLIPVTCGMEYSVTDKGDGTYILGDVTVNGKPLDEDKTYYVMMLGDNNYIEAQIYCNCPMPEELNEKMELMEEKTSAVLCKALNGGNQLESPTEYVKVLH